MRKDPQLIHWILELTLLLYVVGLSSLVEAEASPQSPREFEEMAQEHFEQYCFECHDGETKKGRDLTQPLGQVETDGALVFENIITAKMPPANKSSRRRRSVSSCCSGWRNGRKLCPHRSAGSRHELVLAK